MLSDPIEVTVRVAEVLANLGVACCIGGSIASSAFGIVRATNDGDIIADMREAHGPGLVRALGSEFYASTDAIRDAVRNRSSFNVIHIDTAWKVDVFVAKNRRFDQLQLSRRVRRRLTDDPPLEAFLASPEDTVLSKLEWYRDGGCVSDRQWGDVQGVLKVQAGQLDLQYLLATARTLGVDELLAEALREAGAAA